MLSHALHCTAFAVTLGIFQILGGGLGADSANSHFDPWEQYGKMFTVFLYASRYLVLLILPQAIFNFLGLVVYNGFPPKPQLNEEIGADLPFICFRTVTRGNYPDLVRNNVERNMKICLDVGLKDFAIEVVTDKSIDLVTTDRVKETVVPLDYQTRSGALYKARALQYAIETNENALKDSDWIVHLDEETILTENSVTGIVNLIRDGRYQFGQGLITYASDQIVSLMLTLMDCLRVGEDMGKIRFQLRGLHKVLLGWKGSYMVSQALAEREVSFDNGPDSSVAEDTYFGLLASSKGYHCGFIEGEMWEQSTYTMMDFLQQRKRWLQGVFLAAHSKEIPLKYRFLLLTGVYSWITVPISTLNIIWSVAFPLPIPKIIDVLVSFVGGVTFYLGLYGVYLSFHLSNVNSLKMVAYLLLSILIIPLRIILENISVFWSLLSPKHQFFVVEKQSSLTASDSKV